MSNLREQPTRFNPSQQFGLRYSLENYLAFNPQDARSGYYVSANIQAELLISRLATISSPTMVEAACGTGNSSLAVLTRLQAAQIPVGRFVAFDRSDNSLVAGRRFDQVPQTDWDALIADIPAIQTDVLENIEDTRLFREGLETKTLITQARAQEIPLPSEFADAMFCVQGFHWFLFADADIPGNNPKHILESLKEMRRVLKPGAELVFDTHGGAIDFGTTQWNGKPLNEWHSNYHPLHRAYVAAFNGELEAAGYQTRIIPERPNKYHGRLTESFIQEMLTRAGFEIVPLEQETPYHLHPIQVDHERFITSRRKGGQMVYFSNPEISDLSDAEKSRLLNTAADSISAKIAEYAQIPMYEFLVFFKARAT